mgnify:FL=1
MADYSLGGARLEHGLTHRIPARFTLVFDGLEAEIACEVRHESEGEAGVEFVNRSRSRDPGPPPAVTALLD